MSTTMPASAAGTRIQASSRRARFLRTLRKLHGWIGLWGALLGLLFGVSGILLNHRAVLKIPAAKSIETTVQLPVPQPLPANARALAEWLRAQLKIDAPPGRVREEPAHPVAWGDKTLMQPAHWQFSFMSPHAGVQADYWVGSAYISLRRSESNFWATLGNLHKGVGMGVGWVLLVDTLAGSIILLSLTGVLLWTQLNRRRALGLAIVAVSVGVTIELIVGAW